MLSGDRVIEAAHFEAPATRQNAPGDASELVGESDGQHIVVEALAGSLEPGFEPIAFPVLRPDQYDPGCLNEEHPQVTIAAVAKNSFDSIVPDLATSWSWNDDGKQLAFKLRQGVRWHDRPWDRDH